MVFTRAAGRFDVRACAGHLRRVYGLSRRIQIATATSQQVQNERADSDNLSRMSDHPMILRFQGAGLLQAVPLSTPTFYLHRISSKYRYLRPWTKLFLTRLSSRYHARFRQKLRVTALVRTVAAQQALRRHNLNAAVAVGTVRSSHLTGATLDISKHQMLPEHRQWMRRVLYSLHSQGVIQAIEEFRQPCFHVMVHRSYRDYVRKLQL